MSIGHDIDHVESYMFIANSYSKCLMNASPDVDSTLIETKLKAAFQFIAKRDRDWNLILLNTTDTKDALQNTNEMLEKVLSEVKNGSQNDE